MKKLLAIFAVLISIQSFSQWPWEKIEGNGNIIKQTRSVGSFTSLGSSGSWDVMVAYGESNTIEVEGDENLLTYIETTVENGKLSIRSKKSVNLRSKKKIVIYVTLTRLTGVSLSGSGDIIGEGKFTNDHQTDFKVSGSGNIQISFNRLSKVDAAVSGSGNIRLTGSANSVAARVSGSGNIDCGSVICDDAVAHVSGSGNVKLNANKSVDANISGSGNVLNKGVASDIKKHVSGSGRVSKAK